LDADTGIQISPPVAARDFETGKQEIDSVDIHLRYFLHAIVEIIEIKTAAKGLKLRSNFEPELPEVVRADQR
jgi:hypothetical protein